MDPCDDWPAMNLLEIFFYRSYQLVVGIVLWAVLSWIVTGNLVLRLIGLFCDSHRYLNLGVSTGAIVALAGSIVLTREMANQVRQDFEKRAASKNKFNLPSSRAPPAVV